jgi:hypothetical protein
MILTELVHCVNSNTVRLISFRESPSICRKNTFLKRSILHRSAVIIFFFCLYSMYTIAVFVYTIPTLQTPRVTRIGLYKRNFSSYLFSFYQIPRMSPLNSNDTSAISFLINICDFQVDLGKMNLRHTGNELDMNASF